MEKFTLSRKELYDLVWSTPLLTLSKKYAISDVGLRKICIKKNIPLPGIGYWQKLKHGKRTHKKTLPSKFEGEDKTELALRGSDANTQTSFKSRLLTLTKDIESDQDLPLQVPSKLSNPHRLIISARHNLRSNPQKSYRYGGLINTRDGELDITVTPKMVPRAMRVLNAIINLLKARGHSLIVDRGETYVVIEDEKIQVSLRERLKITKTTDKYGWTNNEYHASGVLAFRLHDIYVRKEWFDNKIPLENKLAKILAYLELYAQKEKEERLQREALRKKREEERRIEQEIKERKEKELKDFKTLLGHASRWEQSRILREYVQAVELQAKKCNNITPELKSWIIWAKDKANWYDPLQCTEDPILGIYAEE